MSVVLRPAVVGGLAPWNSCTPWSQFIEAVSDSDLAPLLRADDDTSQLISVQRLVPSRRPEGPAWESRSVCEVWVGRDADADGNETPIFRDDDGTEFTQANWHIKLKFRTREEHGCSCVEAAGQALMAAS